MASFSGNPNDLSLSHPNATQSDSCNPNFSNQTQPPISHSSSFVHDSTITTVLPHFSSIFVAHSAFAPSSFSSSVPFSHSYSLPPFSSRPFLPSSSFISPPHSSSTSFFVPPQFSIPTHNPFINSAFHQSPYVLNRPVPLLSSLNQESPIKLDGDNFLTWESTVMPIIRDHRLDGHFWGLMLFHLNTSSTLQSKFALILLMTTGMSPTKFSWAGFSAHSSSAWLLK